MSRKRQWFAMLACLHARQQTRDNNQPELATASKQDVRLQSLIIYIKSANPKIWLQTKSGGNCEVRRLIKCLYLYYLSAFQWSRPRDTHTLQNGASKTLIIGYLQYVWRNILHFMVKTLIYFSLCVCMRLLVFVYLFANMKTCIQYTMQFCELGALRDRPRASYCTRY